MLSHRNLVSNSEVLRNFWQFTENDVLLHMLPIYHTHGLFVACNLLAIVGGSMIFWKNLMLKSLALDEKSHIHDGRADFLYKIVGK